MTADRDRLLELLRKSKEKLAQQKEQGTPVQQAAIHVPKPEYRPVDKTASEIVEESTRMDPTADSSEFSWNDEQKDAINRARKGESFNLIGAAGTGKTTTEKEVCRVLVAEDIVPVLDMSTKYLQRGSPGILVTSFTRRAVRNSRRVLPDDIKPHCVTLHKVLEFEPIFYEVWDEVKGEMRKTMRFEPQRNMNNPLPSTLKCIIIDESSMVSTELFKQLLDALPDPAAVQFIFVGDLHQLPPVYGTAILGFKLLELPTVELKKIYRQAQKSPIIMLAHKIKNGEDVPLKEKRVEETDQGKVVLHPWKKALSDFDAMHTCSKFLENMVKSGDFNEEEDIILCPQEKTKNLAFGTNEFNRVVAQALGEGRKGVDDKGRETERAFVYEIIAGYEKHYLAVGDRLLVGREDAIITKITRNAKYWGKRPRPASIELDRWGNYKKKVVEEEGDDFDVDKYLESFDLTPDTKDEDRKQEASHLIDVKLLDSEKEETLTSAGDINASQFAYCLTVHKSQGSEWNRVFFLTHQSHVVMWNRELLYTAITRARKEFYAIVEPDRASKLGTLSKAARSPRIKGDTLAEKAEYFKGKKEEWDKEIEIRNQMPRGISTEGQYKGQAPAPAVRVPVSEKPPVQVVRFAEYVSANFKKQAQEKLDTLWERAKIIWGADRIGKKPEIDYNLQSSKVIGLASYLDNKMKLNAVWCVLADPLWPEAMTPEELEMSKKIWNEMIEDTIPHELAHFINQHYSTPKGKGHDGGWIMAAKLLGMKNPQETLTDNTLPSWATMYRDAAVNVVKLFNQKLQTEGKEFSMENDNVYLSDSTEA
jgi:hypothetical protein